MNESQLTHEQALEQLRDIRGLLSIELASSPLMWIIIAALVVGALALWWWLRRFRRQHQEGSSGPTPPNPEAWFEERLQTLTNSFDRQHEFAFTLGLNLRQYLHYSLQLSTLEMTSEEVLRALRRQASWKLLRQRVEAIFDTLDPIRYADHEASTEALQDSLTKARELIELRREALAQQRHEEENSARVAS